MSEQAPSREQITESFKSLVNKAVEPVMQQRQRGIFPVYDGRSVEAAALLVYESDKITFERRRDLGLAAIAELVEIELDSSHVIKIAVRDYSSSTTQSTFGINRLGSIGREYWDGALPFMRTPIIRELEPDETLALLDYVSAPHLNYSSRTKALRLLPSEQEAIEAAKSNFSGAEAELRQVLKEDTQARSRAYQASLGFRVGNN